MLVQHPILERHPAAEHRRELDLADRQRRPGRHRRGVLVGLLLELGRRVELVHDAELLRLRRRHGRAAEHEIERLLAADEPRKPLGAAGAGQHAQRHLGQPDVVCALRREAEVTAERDLQATAETVSVDRGDDDLRRALELRHDLVRVDDERRLVVGVGRREHLHVRARGEELLRGAANDDGLDRRGKARLVDGRRQVVEEGLVV